MLTLTVCRLIGNWPLAGTRTAQETLLPVALLINARFAIQFGVIHFLRICRADSLAGAAPAYGGEEACGQ